MRSILFAILISSTLAACNNDTELPVPPTPTNAHIILYSYDCIQGPANCIDDETNRVANVSHLLFDSQDAYTQGIDAVKSTISDSNGTARWSELDVQEYYLTSTFEDLIIEQSVTVNMNTTLYITVAFE